MKTIRTLVLFIMMLMLLSMPLHYNYTKADASINNTTYCDEMIDDKCFNY